MVMCATMTSSCSELLSDFKPVAVVVDEASQCTEADVIGALNHRAEKVVFFGDEMQLSPTVISNNLILKTSLFKDIIEKRPDAATMLTVQYRMHPQISYFANYQFYSMKIKDGVKVRDRQSKYDLFKGCSIAVINCHG